ncbi:MAG: GPR endopeptidase [Clostridiales bacterium]|jgi:spore protease|nr:GPR endopeptidase [Clostridiales bacterium]
MKNIYTDLALEVAEALIETTQSTLDGVEIERTEYPEYTVTWVKVTNETGARILSREIGNYVTVESQSLRTGDVTAHEKIIEVLVDIIARLKKNDDGDVLVVGLGNHGVTPDALGPRVVSKTFVTRNILNEVPDETRGKTRPVAAVAPGVLGTTGIETRDIVKGICEKMNPSLVIAVDALAARKTSRVNTTIQVTDTGIVPGGGMGNARAALNEYFLGTQVIAIGVPTVVDAATLVTDCLDSVLELLAETEQDTETYSELSKLREEEKYEIVSVALEPYDGNMFVTPKEVDEVIARLSNVIANALNISLHKGITLEDINRFMY